MSRFPLAAIAAVLLLAAAACSGGSDSDSDTAKGAKAEVVSVVLARGRTAESLPIDPTSTFAPNVREIWGIVTLRALEGDAEVTGVWSFLGSNGLAAPKELARAAVSQPPADSGSDTIYHVALVMRKPTDFDLGVYQLDVLMDGDSQVKLQFSVAQPAATTNGSGPATGSQTTTTATPTPVAAVLASVTTAPTPGRPPGDRYTVQSGDTLALLAGLWGVSADAVIDLNNLGDGSLIIAGEVLLVPELTTPTPVTTPTPPPAAATATPTPAPAVTPSATITPATTGTPTPTRTPTQ